MEAQKTTPTNTSTGIQENVEGLLVYLLTWVTGIVFLIIEKKSSFVRFHALQSIITFLGLMVLGFVAGFLPFIGTLISFAVFPLTVFLWVFLMYKAYQGEKYKLPIIGDIAEQQAAKIKI